MKLKLIKLPIAPPHRWLVKLISKSLIMIELDDK